VAELPTGVEGAVANVTAAEAAEATLVPRILVAVTLNL
jgi:hypothetical protein